MGGAAGGPQALDAREDGRSLRAQLRTTATPGWGHKHLPSQRDAVCRVPELKLATGARGDGELTNLL